MTSSSGELRRALAAALVACVWLLTGCAGTIHQAAQNATESAVDALDAPKYKKELDDMAAEAAGAARDELLDPAKLSPKLDAIRDNFLPPLRLQLQGVPDDLLGPHTRTQGMYVLDGWLSTLDTHADTLRERLVGQPLRDDVDALIAEAGPKLGAAAAASLQQSLAPIRVQVDAEVTSVKATALWIGGAALALLALGLGIHALLTHRKLAALSARLEAR